MKFSLAGLSKFDFFGVFILRSGLGALVAIHGFPLFISGPNAWKRVGDPVSLAGIDSFHLFFGLASVMIQAFGGLALIAGLFTRGAALLQTIILGFAMASAYQRGESLLDQMVYAQITLACFALILIGPGRFSLDRRGI